MMIAAAADSAQATAPDDVKRANIARPALPFPSFHVLVLYFPSKPAVFSRGLDVVMALTE
jgi:hypothetical protein